MNNKDMPAMPCDDIVIRDKNGNFQGAPISCTGITKLEHFAGLAMQGLVTAQNEEGEWAHDANTVASTAVSYAKALLKQLEDDGL